MQYCLFHLTLQNIVLNQSTEISAFKLINAIIRNCPIEVLGPYLPTVLQLLLMRMRENRTPQSCRLFVHCICVMVTYVSVEQTYALLEQIQIGMVTMILTQIWLPSATMLKSSDEKDTLEIIVGAAYLMCESPVSQDPALFAQLLKFILLLLNKVPLLSSLKAEGLYEEDEVGAMEFDNTYSKLAFAQVEVVSDITSTQMVQLKFAQILGKLCVSRPGQIVGYLPTFLNEEEMQVLQVALHHAGITLT